MKNNWQDTIIYLNSKAGKVITMIDMEVDLNHIRPVILCGNRGTLIKLGYLKRIAKQKYRVLKKIPEDLGYMYAKRKVRDMIKEMRIK